MVFNVKKKVKETGFVLTCLFFFSLLISTQQSCTDSKIKFLVKVDIIESVEQIGLPVHAHLQNAEGQDYALVIASEDQLVNSGVFYEILDPKAHLLNESSYLIALERITGARSFASREINVLHDDGRNIVVRVTESEAASISKMGFEIEWLSKDPIVFQEKQDLILLEDFSSGLEFNAEVSEMINSVNQEMVYDYISKITGEIAVNVGGVSYIIKSRNSNSGTSINNATQFVYEFMEDLGLSVSYHNWSGFFTSNRNVIGEKTGSRYPDEIILITAHFDCMPSGSAAPGADDNGSGSVGVMVAAEMLSQYNFEKTIRFVFFTGEEQGLYGSKNYASKVVSDGDNIVAVMNLDMIAWDAVGGPVFRVHTRTKNNSGYSSDIALANTVKFVVNTYGMSSGLSPVIDSDGITASDHSSFWNKGIPAIIVVEDDKNDMGKNFHSTRDRASTLNMPYFTNMVKTVVGASAHLAVPVEGHNIKAGFTYSKKQLTVDFKDASKAPGNSQLTNWSWDFGDGDRSSEKNPSHTYAEPGTYTVKLTVADQEGVTDSFSEEISVSDKEEPECWEECKEVGSGCDKETVCETVCEE